MSYVLNSYLLTYLPYERIYLQNPLPSVTKRKYMKSFDFSWRLVRCAWCDCAVQHVRSTVSHAWLRDRASVTSVTPATTTTARLISARVCLHATAAFCTLSRYTLSPRKKRSPWACLTRRPASADRTALRQFQTTGQPVSRTQASDAMTSRLPRYEAKCVQRRCFQCASVPLRSDIKGTELPSANILIPLERQLIALQLSRWQFLYNETLQQTFRPLLSILSKRRQI